MSEELEFLSDLIADNLEDSSKIDELGYGLKMLERSDKELNKSTLYSVTGEELEENLYKNLYYSLENTGVIEDQNIDRYALDMVLESAKLKTESTENKENNLVATIPDAEDSIDSSKYNSLLLNLRELIERSEKKLILMNPFFTENIASRLKTPLKNAAKNDVEIHIVTRYLTYTENEKNKNFVRTIFEDEDIRQQTKLFEYKEWEKFGSTFHAKIMLSERSSGRDECYMGTANLTRTGLERNLEVGMIFRDENVTKISNLITSLMSSSLVNEVTYDEEKFRRY